MSIFLLLKKLCGNLNWIFPILNGNSSLFIHQKIFYFFLECPHNRYGTNCQSGCHCSNPSECSYETCLCANGWKGIGCNDGKSNNIVHSNYIFKYIFTYIYLYIYIYIYFKKKQWNRSQRIINLFPSCYTFLKFPKTWKKINRTSSDLFDKKTRIDT